MLGFANFELVAYSLKPIYIASLRRKASKHSPKLWSVVRSNCIHAVFHGHWPRPPDESGYYERVWRMLTKAMCKAGSCRGYDNLHLSLDLRQGKQGKLTRKTAENQVGLRFLRPAIQVDYDRTIVGTRA